MASIDREGLRKALEILPRFEILLVLALGKPKENVMIGTVGDSRDTEYWREMKRYTVYQNAP